MQLHHAAVQAMAGKHGYVAGRSYALRELYTGLRVATTDKEPMAYEGESVALVRPWPWMNHSLKEWDSDAELNALMGTDVLVDLQDHYLTDGTRNSMRLIIQTRAER